MLQLIKQLPVTPPLNDDGEPIYVEPPYQCRKCSDTKWDWTLGNAVRPCECAQAARRARLLELANLPVRYRDTTFQTFSPDKTLSIRHAYTHARQFCDEFPLVGRGLLFMGPCGTGKTHLAAAIVRELTTQKGAPCKFYEFGALLKAIRDCYNPATNTTELQALSSITEAQVLALDELGAQKPTEWALDTLMHIINTRYNEKRLTIFTTNYLDERRSEREETLSDRIGARVRSRLYEMAKTVVMNGNDYRREIK